MTPALTATLFGLSLAWSATSTLQALGPETGLAAKMDKIRRISSLRITQLTIAVLAGSIALIPAYRLYLLTTSLVGITLYILLSIKYRRLATQTHKLHQEQAVMALTLGTLNHKENGTPLRIWFKKAQGEWPLVELETGVGPLTTPIDETDSELMKGEFLPRIAIAVSESPDHPVFHAMKQDLLQHGVTHPIDIKGWDCHPVVRTLVEVILNAPSAPDFPMPQDSAPIRVSSP